MQTKTYKDLYSLISALAGVNSFTDEEKKNIVNFINRRYLQAYNMSPNWVRYLTVGEERSVSSFNVGGFSSVNADLNQEYYNYGKTSSGTNIFVPIDQTRSATPSNRTLIFYRVPSGVNENRWTWATSAYTKTAEGIVTIPSTNVYAQSGDVDANGAYIKHDSPADVKIWTWNSAVGLAEPDKLIVERSQLAAFDETYEVFAYNDERVLKPVINEFVRVYEKKPLLNESAREYDFYTSDKGANLLNIVGSTPSNAFVTYKKAFTAFVTQFGSVTISVEEVPIEFYPFIAHASYADFLRMDGQHQKALVEEQTAQGAIDMQLERNDIISNINNATTRFSTYVNRQSR